MRLRVNENRYISEVDAPYIIAEAGINHNGEFDIAKRLIAEAAHSGADAIKFQKRTIDEMYTKEFLDVPYQKSYAFGATYGEHKKFLEFSDEQYFELQAYAASLNIEFLVSGFDFSSFDFVERALNVPIHKIASPFITHYPLLKHVAQFGKPIILSTGMHTMEEIRKSVEYIKQFNDQIVLFQATTLYPCPNQEVNLNVLKSFKEELGVLVGYSSHDSGVAIPAASVALGACVIEKHFTLDRAMIGPDHSASVEPRGLELICKYSKAVHQSLGDGVKRIHDSEAPQRIKYGVSVVSAREIPHGKIIEHGDITVKCPGGGISPVEFDTLFGRVSTKEIKADTVIYDGDIV